jgi:hypothetical protein
VSQSTAVRKEAPPQSGRLVIYIWKRNGWRKLKLRER